MRSFISLDLPDEAVQKVKKIQDSLPEFIGKKTESENFHLTLKFLGDIDKNKIELIKEKLNEVKIKKFTAEIDSIGVFSEKIIRIVWLHLANCDRLQKRIEEVLQDLGFKPEQRFMGHLTIARVKRIHNKKDFLEKLEKIKIPKIRFIAENFKLKSSTLNAEGPVYEEIRAYNLK